MSSTFPTEEYCVIRNLLERNAREQPDATFASFASGAPDWSYREVLDDTRQLAWALRRAGVQQDDCVAVWLPNGRAALRAWFAINYLGAIFVPLNLAYRGRLLEHAIEVCGARYMFSHPDLAPRLAEIDPGPLSTLFVEGSSPETHPALSVVSLGSLGQDHGRHLDLPRQIRPWDGQAIIFTSGTTGPSKGVLISYAHLFFSSTSQPNASREDRNLVYSPLFHVSATGAVFRSLVYGGSCAVIEAFKTQTFWSDVRRTGATRSSIMGSMASFLLAQPVSEDERETPLKNVVLSPLSQETIALAKRIGAYYYTVFNMTEVSLPIVSGPYPEKPGTCGRPRAGVEARIVDENDLEVSAGAVGELILRTEQPWAISTQYYNAPEATARAWRNGWFHTGDAFRIDDQGEYVFVDRIKDAIRRRGENISSYEVELEALAHPLVSDCAAVATPSEYGEDEVLLVVELVEGGELAPELLLQFMKPRTAHYMLPRYIRLVPSLPRTPTHKVQKQVLRSEGVTADTWDREAVGFKFSRDQIRT